MYLVIAMLARLFPTLPALGSLFLLTQDTGLLVETPATNLRQHTISLNLFVETLQRALEGLVLINDNPRHISPSPLTSHASRQPEAYQLFIAESDYSCEPQNVKSRHKRVLKKSQGCHSERSEARPELGRAESAFPTTEILRSSALAAPMQVSLVRNKPVVIARSAATKQSPPVGEKGIASLHSPWVFPWVFGPRDKGGPGPKAMTM